MNNSLSIGKTKKLFLLKCLIDLGFSPSPTERGLG